MSPLVMDRREKFVPGSVWIEICAPLKPPYAGSKGYG